MSTSDTSLLGALGHDTAPVDRPAGELRALARLTRSELRLVFRRRRNIALLAVLAAAPVLLGVAVKVSAPQNGEGPPFLAQVTQNGLFLALTSLVVALPLFLPLAVAVVAGEAVAGEAGSGTLRNLLVVPVGRPRVLLVKYAGIVAYALVAALLVAVVGAVVGLLLFPSGEATLLSGQTVPLSDAMLRAFVVALYVAAMLAGVGAVGLFVSTLTEVPLGAAAATAVLTIVSEILDSIPQISAVHPYLFTHRWLAFGDLLRSPVSWHQMEVGLLTQVAYVAVFGSLAWARFTTRDVTS